MKRWIAWLACLALIGAAFPVIPGVASEPPTRADKAVYRMPVEDQGILLEPGKEGESSFAYDGGGIREGNITKVGDVYYLFYDGAAMPDGKSGNDLFTDHLWRGCLAKSTDLLHWEKLGPRLKCGFDVDPQSNPDTYKDFYSASSPWPYFNEEDNHWYLFYLGAEGAAMSGADIGTPAVYYSTLVAKAETPGLEGIEGNYLQYNHIKGQEKHVALWDKPATISPGSVIQNPEWTGSDDTSHQRYMMFATRGAQIWIARSNRLDATHPYDVPGGQDDWMPGDPVLGISGETAPENATIFHDEKTGWYYLFTNQFSLSYTYTDCNVVYWSKDPNTWDPNHCAVVTDARSTKDQWATGAIGMPSVVRVDDDTVAIVYDACKGDGTSHLHRCLGLAYWKLPRLSEDGKPLDFEPQVPIHDESELPEKHPNFINDDDGSVRYEGDFVYDRGTIQNGRGDIHYTNTGGSITFIFEGCGFQWIGQKVFNRGKSEIFIDGESYGIVDQYDEGILYQQVIFEIHHLKPGNHTVRIVNQSEYTCFDGYITDPDGMPSVSFDTDQLSMRVGDEQKLSFTVCPDTAEIVFESHKPDIVFVNADGVVCAKKAGQAVITVSIPGSDPLIHSECTITVLETETETETDVESATEPETEPETEPATEPDTDPATETQTEPPTEESMTEGPNPDGTGNTDENPDQGGCRSVIGFDVAAVGMAALAATLCRFRKKK